jgi:hypothetical protein
MPALEPVCGLLRLLPNGWDQNGALLRSRSGRCISGDLLMRSASLQCLPPIRCEGTGRAGLFPSRYQSDQTDTSGPIIRFSNRRLRCALMRIADNIADHCTYYRGIADTDLARGVDIRAGRVRIVKKFSRLAFACLASDEPMRHPAFREPDSILEKLQEFHGLHQTPMDQLLADLQATVKQLSYSTRNYEAKVVAEVLRNNASRKRGGIAIGELLPAVLARLRVNPTEITQHDTLQNEDRS